jgi:hypothetical protein
LVQNLGFTRNNAVEVSLVQIRANARMLINAFWNVTGGNAVLPGVGGLQKPDERKQWTSAHVCPRCGFPIDLENLGLRSGTTGLVTCPKCDWSGPVEIRIIDKEPSD